MLEIKRIKDYLKYLLVLVVVFFLVKYLYENWRAVSLYRWQFKYGLLAISFGVVFLNFLFFIQIWRNLLNKFSVGLLQRLAIQSESKGAKGGRRYGKI